MHVQTTVGSQKMNVLGISTVKVDEEGEPYIELNPDLIRQMGWDPPSDLEWEIVGHMAVIRKKEDAGNSIK